MTMTPVLDAEAALPLTLRTRLASFGEALGLVARRTPGPAGIELRTLVDEYVLIRRDVRNFAAAAAAVDAPPPPAPPPGTNGHAAPSAAGPLFGPPAGRRLPNPCTQCGGAIYRPPGVRGRAPKRCDACRTGLPAASPEPQRFVRVGYRVMTVEILPTDPIVSHSCGECEEELLPGQRVQSSGPIYHEACNDA